MTNQAKKKTTKSAFISYLNEKYGYSMDKRGVLRGASKRLYGDWLYSADREYFNLAYKSWLETGSDAF